MNMSVVFYGGKVRTIIAGSRDNVTYLDVCQAVSECGWKPSVILSGTARGTDQYGERYAKENNIPLEKYPADWDLYGKSAGYKRNILMAEKQML